VHSASAYAYMPPVPMGCPQTNVRPRGGNWCATKCRECTLLPCTCVWRCEHVSIGRTRFFLFPLLTKACYGTWLIKCGLETATHLMLMVQGIAATRLQQDWQGSGTNRRLSLLLSAWNGESREAGRSPSALELKSKGPKSPETHAHGNAIGAGVIN
jgi:hypothetical protein